MPEKIYFLLLILCGIVLFDGFTGTFADEEIKESSDSLVRQKRVVSYVENEDNIVTINNAPHVVIIKLYVTIHCTGSIISPYTVITAASCIQRNLDLYKISSATSSSSRGNHTHDIIDNRMHLAISLLSVRQPFIYGAYSHNIQLNVSPLLPHAVGHVYGWGYNWRAAVRGTNHTSSLRSIQVPIISHRECSNRYQPHIRISENEVCTYDPRRHCGHNDFGAGLVVDGYLAGVFLWSGLDQNKVDPRYPDVFAILQHSDYNQWIGSNVRDIVMHAPNPI